MVKRLEKNPTVHQDHLNRLTPGSYGAALGDCLYDTINALNDLKAQYALLLAHIDTGNVAGIGNANTATFGPTLPAVLLPEQR